MRPSLLVRGLVSLGLLLLLTCPARAELIFWSSEIYALPTRVFSDQGEGAGLVMPGTPFTVTTAGSASRSLTISPYLADPGPATFSGQDFTLILKLTDLASGAEETLSMNGQFFGTLTPDSADITATFWTDVTSRFQLGANDYTVSLFDPATGALAFVPPSGVNSLGSLTARVEVEPSVAAPEDAPEPSTLALAALGLLPAVLVWRRRRPA